MAFVLASGGMGAALYMGNCTGHGTGVGGSFQPGHGGGMVPGCPHAPLDPRINVRDVVTNSATAIWPPTPQLPLGVAGAVAAKVVINKLVPIVDQDILITHPTPTVYTTSSVGTNCSSNSLLFCSCFSSYVCLMVVESSDGIAVLAEKANSALILGGCEVSSLQKS